jgi:ABC-type transport system substrate-binding protein
MAARFVAYRRTPPVYDLVLYNVDTGVQAGPRLREALHSGVPRERAEREIYGFPGLHLEAPVDLEAPTPIDLAALVDARAGELGRAGLPAPLPATTDPAGIASAVAELERLGWPLERGSRRRAGGQLRVTIMWDPAPGRATALFELLREGWRALGIVVTQATASWSYLSTLMRAGQFDVALVRLAEPSDADLFDHFHSRGETNMAKVRDAVLDQALEDYRSADDRTGRDAAKVRIAERLTALRVSTILHAPVEIMLIDKRVSGVHFLDDLPLLDSLHP